MTLASLLALGFLLGMRHATDADHVAAYDGLSVAVGLATLLLGCYIVYRTGVGHAVVG
jgi:hypothetical protein